MQNQQLIIPVNGPFNFKECLWFLDRGYDDCLIRVYRDHFRKALIVENEEIIFDVFGDIEGLKVTIISGKLKEQTIDYIKRYLTEWFDLENDLEDYYRAISFDERLNYMSDTFYGLRLIGIPDLFEAIVWCIIGQQINLTFAYKIKRRLVEEFGKQVNCQNQTFYIFPSPQDFKTVDPQDLLRIQLSKSKANYILEVAKAFLEGRINKKVLIEQASFELQQRLLMSIKGIGLWTANYVLMKCIRINNSVPYGDAGLSNALIQHQIIANKTDLVGTKHFFRQFEGWESYLVFYLWHSLSKNVKINSVHREK